MNVEQRIKAFTKLGIFFKQFNTSKIERIDDSEINSIFFEPFKNQIEKAQDYNGWFTKKNVLKAFEGWSNSLTEKNLQKWTSKYNFNTTEKSKNIAIIMAGNIPLVGFHDFLSVLICGHNAIIKQSSNDTYFLPLVAKFLEFYNPYFKNKIQFTDKKLPNFDAVIATGSNNTAKYFEYYFKKHPAIIRKNRNSVAVLTGDETKKELENLGEDIFQYFGLGCRSVSKIFVPKNYNFKLLFSALYKFKDTINYKKYENNYNYNKAVYLMSSFKLQENGFLMLKEDTSYASPIATLFYEYYNSLDQLMNRLSIESNQIQCIAGNKNIAKSVKFGQTQHPKLWNYADDVDTIDFLLKL